jgi:TonB-linked SusC/RagA family outer membrane protein
MKKFCQWRRNFAGFLPRKVLLAMRLSLGLFLLVSFQTIASVTYSQDTKVTVKMNHAQVKEVLKEIERSSEFYFVYNNELIDVERVVNVEARNQKIKDILDALFSDEGVSYTVMGRQIVLSPEELMAENIDQPQQKTVRGTVADQKGEAIPGVTVTVKGTTRGTITDVDGNFSLSIPADAEVLVFSFVGMRTQEVPIEDENTFNVSLEEDLVGLDEVVVVGYGTMKKSDLTGAVARADMSALDNSPNVNVLQGLKGTVPGLNIGAVTTAGGNPEISIRGRNSISGTTSPLIVLDGIIFRGEFTDINPNDIESIDVLKDASSSAIYGSQGANGVLLITTKKAERMSKPVIEYSGKYTTQSLINKDINRLDREGFLNQLADVYISESRMGADLLQRNPDFDVVPLFRDGAVAEGYADETDTDWWNLLSNPNPYIQDHSLSLRGKNELTSYFVSFGYTDQENMVKNDTYERYSVRVNLNANVTDWLKVGTQSFFNVSDFSGSDPGFSSLCYIPALVNPYNEDGSFVEQIYLGNTNPLLTVKNPDEDIRRTLSGNFFADISIPWISGLNYRINYSKNMVTYKDYNFNPYANSGLGSANKYIANRDEMTFDNIISYENDFGLHSIQGTFVYGIEERKYENTNAASENFTDKTLGYNELQAGQSDLNSVSSDAWKETGLYNMLRAVYTYNDRYILTGTVRRDGFSGFGSKNKFGVFPSGAIAWRMSEENFIRNNFNWIDNLKLRLSYGTGGNRTIGRYATMAQITSELPGDRTGGYLYGDGATGELTQAVQTLANEDLKWETTASTNLGVDFSFLGGKLFGNYEFYISKTTDLLYDINIPSMNGIFQTSIPTNIGELKNVGHEISITGVPVKTNDLEWTITGNFSTNKNEVVTILGLDNDGDGNEDDLISSNIFIGESLGTIYDYNIIGMWQVSDYNAGNIPNGFTYGTYKVEDINDDGEYTPEDDRKILGYSDPLYRFSIRNTLKYKNFELSAFINSVQGGKDHYLGQPASELPIPDHLTNNSYFKFDYWTPENPDAKYRQLGSYTPALGADFSPYVSRSFIRLQELSLAYNFSSELLSSMSISRAKVFVSATNLFTITDWDGWDPEANQGLTYNLKTPTDGEDQYSAYPTMKGFTIGLNFEF